MRLLTRRVRDEQRPFSLLARGIRVEQKKWYLISLTESARRCVAIRIKSFIHVTRSWLYRICCHRNYLFTTWYVRAGKSCAMESFHYFVTSWFHYVIISWFHFVIIISSATISFLLWSVVNNLFWYTLQFCRLCCCCSLRDFISVPLLNLFHLQNFKIKIFVDHVVFPLLYRQSTLSLPKHH